MIWFGSVSYDVIVHVVPCVNTLIMPKGRRVDYP